MNDEREILQGGELLDRVFDIFVTVPNREIDGEVFDLLADGGCEHVAVHVHRIFASLAVNIRVGDVDDGILRVELGVGVSGWSVDADAPPLQCFYLEFCVDFEEGGILGVDIVLVVGFVPRPSVVADIASTWIEIEDLNNSLVVACAGCRDRLLDDFDAEFSWKLGEYGEYCLIN